MREPLLPLPCFEKHKKMIFGVMLYGFFTQCMNLSILGPFFPIKAAEFDIGDTMIGLIFSSFPLGAIICTVFIRSRLNGKRKTYMIIGVLLLVLGMAGFGCIFYFQNKILIIVGSIICRFIMGVGMSLYDSPSLSFIPLLFHTKIDRKLGMIEGIQNIGFLLGPLLGTVLYNVGNYEIPFFVMAALQSITIPLLIFLIPKQQDISEYIRSSSLEKRISNFKDTDETIDREQQFILSIQENQTENQRQRELIENQITDLVIDSTRDVRYYKALAHFRVFLIVAMIFFVACGFLFLDSSYASFLQTQFQLTQDQINYLFVASYSCSTLSSYIVSLFTCKRQTNLKLMFCGFCLLFVSYLFIGPAKFFGIKSSLVLTIISRCLISCFQSIVYIPAIKEFYFTLSNIFYKCDDDQLLSNMSSTLYILSQQSGELIGPIVGNVIIEHMSFNDASSYFSIFSLAAIVIVLLSKKAFKSLENQSSHFNSTDAGSLKHKLSEEQFFYCTQDELLSNDNSKNISSSEISEKEQVKRLQ